MRASLGTVFTPEIVFALRTVLALGAFLSACATSPRAPVRSEDSVPSELEGDSGPMPLVRAHGLLFVEVRDPSDSPILALLDTGANASAIDPRRAVDSKPIGKSDVVGTTGSVAAEIVELAGLRLGALALPSLRATHRDLSGLLSPDGRAVEMILGSDAFLGRALTIDFEQRSLDLGPSSPPTSGDLPTGRGELPTSTTDGVPMSRSGEVPMSLDQGIPAIPARLDGIATTLRIDTGASLFETLDVYVNVPGRIWSALRGVDPELAPTSHLRGTGANGESVELPVARVRGSTIGAKAFDAVFVIVQPETGYFADPAAKGFVGVNFLEKLGRVTLDYGRGRMSASSTSTAGIGANPTKT